MKSLLTIIAICMATTSISAQAPGALAIGSSVPMANAKMKSTDGKELSMKEVMKKNGLLVMFSCNTCPYVVRYQSRTTSILKEAAKNKIGVIIINSNEEYRNDEDSYEKMKTYARQQQYTPPYVVDTKSKVADAFGATRTPECFLFDASGKLIYHGAIDDNQDATKITRTHLSIAFTEHLSGKDIATKETRSIGCMIKRID